MKPLFFRYVSIIFVLIFPPIIACTSASEVDKHAELHATIRKIQDAPSSSAARDEIASKLPRIAREAAALNQVDDEFIDQLVNLLPEKRDAVDSWAALALGDIGPPAKRALPALLAALAEADREECKMVFHTGIILSDTIRTAIKRIDDSIEVGPGCWAH